MPPRVCIIVLTWKNYDLTPDCLLSLRQVDYANTEVVLVDNGSGDGSAESGQTDQGLNRTRNSLLIARKHVPVRYWPGFLLSLGTYVAYRSAGYLLRAEPKRIKELYRGLCEGCTTKI